MLLIVDVKLGLSL